MSCEIVSKGEIVDLQAVKEFFGFLDPDWINGVHFSFSPNLEHICFAHGNLLVVLSAKWCHDSQQNIYKISAKKVLDPNELITSLHVIPISMQNHSDWTLILLGVDTGLIRFFMESGKEIHSQCFHNEPVQSIKSQSGKKVNEEIHISYASCVCIIQGSLLLPTLISLRQQLKKVRHEVDPPTTPILVNIPVRKWGIGDNRGTTVVDNAVVGSQKTCSFDHLLTASLDSFSAKYRNAPPQHSLIIGCGSKPYVTFNYGTEGYVQPVLKDVAKALASKVITWFSSSNQTPAQTSEPAAVAPVAAEPMICRFGLCDASRNACGIWLAPCCEHSDVQLAVVTDNLGRVVLLDCEKGIVLRMWKGYRDAQVGFIKTREKMSKTADKRDQRSAVFLIIYAPRRATIEIWPLQHGHKIATFHASKRGQLIYVPHNVMGASVHNEKLKYSNNSCIFFDPSERLIKEITIPFHCALSDSNSKTAKDLHLLKRLKTLLKSRTDPPTGPTQVDDEDEAQFQQEITGICENLQTLEMKQHCLDFLVKNRKTTPKIFENALRSLSSSTDVEEDAAAFGVQCENYLRLIAFYNYLTSDESVTTGAVEPLEMTDSELVTIEKMLGLTAGAGERNKSPTMTAPKVKFEEREVDRNNFMDYLGAWTVGGAAEIHLKADCKSEVAATVGEIVFKRFLEGRKPLAEFVKRATDVGVPCEDLLKLFLNCWLRQPCVATTSDAVVEELSHFNATLIQICVLAGTKVRYDNATVCRWWQTMREFFLVGNSCPLRSLLAAMVCRHVGVKYQEDSADENWEQVSQELAQWTLLIGKLDEVAVLNIVISRPKVWGRGGLPKLPYEHTNISLEQILAGGKGIISEVVSKWLTAADDIDPDVLITTISGKVEGDFHEDDAIKTLQQYFPFSMRPDVLLCHVAWNYLSYWSKNLSQIGCLEAGITCWSRIPVASNHLKHGLAVMVWNAHLKFPLEALKRLIDKTGRLPKEKLCLQDLGFSDSLAPPFLDVCTRFLATFADCLGYEPMPAWQHEDLLQDGPIPLAQLALEQNRANSVLLALHSELTQILHAIAFFNVKYKYPVRTLFDGLACQSFFADINRSLAFTLPQADLILRKKRTEFLCLLVTHTVDLIREELDATSLYLDDHLMWMGRIEQIADTWGLDNEDLKRHHVAELYKANYDAFAEEQIEKIIDTQSMGKTLLEITAVRLKRYAHLSAVRYSQIAAVGPSLTDYLEKLPALDNNETYDVNLDSLCKLCGQTFQCLSQKTSKELRLAGLLMNACISMKEQGL